MTGFTSFPRRTKSPVMDISGDDPTVFEVPFIGMPSDANVIADSLDALLAPASQVNE